jgi:hypothetical protein
VVWKRRTLVAEPGAWSQSDSLGAEDFGHVPEGFVEPEIFIDAFDRPTLVHPAPVGSAARMVALAATDKVFLNLCGAARYRRERCALTRTSALHNDSLHINSRMLSSTLLNRVQGGPKILGTVSVASGIEEHRGLTRQLTAGKIPIGLRSVVRARRSTSVKIRSLTPPVCRKYFVMNYIAITFLKTTGL